MPTPVIHYRPLGTLVGHTPECRCDTCVSARRYNNKLRQTGHRERWTYNTIHPYVKRLTEAAGGNVPLAAKTLGIGVVTMRNYLRGGDSEARPSVVARILAKSPEDMVSVPTFYPRAHFKWRLGVLSAQGYPQWWIEKQMGLTSANRGIFSNPGATVSAFLWEPLDAVWRQYSPRLADGEKDSLTPYSINWTRNWAHKLGYRPLAAYDNEFDAKPADTSDMAGVLRNDQKRVDSIIALRVKAGLRNADIVTELQKLYPDFNIENACERTRTRLKREEVREASTQTV